LSKEWLTYGYDKTALGSSCKSGGSLQIHLKWQKLNNVLAKALFESSSSCQTVKGSPYQA
jgi:hypothetical protein